jgi:hypothetical protein
LIPIDARDDALAPRTTDGAHTGAEGTVIALANVLAASRRTNQPMAARVSRRERVVGNLILTAFIGLTDAPLDQVGAGAQVFEPPAFEDPYPRGPSARAVRGGGVDGPDAFAEAVGELASSSSGVSSMGKQRYSS